MLLDREVVRGRITCYRTLSRNARHNSANDESAASSHVTELRRIIFPGVVRNKSIRLSIFINASYLSLSKGICSTVVCLSNIFSTLRL